MLAEQTLASSGLRVRVPRVHASLVTARLLGMEYVDGVKLTEMRSAGGFGDEEVLVRCCWPSA